VIGGSGTPTYLLKAPYLSVSAGPDQAGIEGVPVTFDGSYIDPNNTDTHTDTWQVLDSSGAVVGGGSGQDFTFTPPDGGTYTVTFTVADNQGGMASAHATLTAGDVPPTLAPPGDQTAVEGTAGLFSLGSINDPLPTGNFHLTIDWGDGSAPSVFHAGTSGTIASQPHAYAEEGTYKVVETVAENDGGSDSKSFQVVVSDLAVLAAGVPSLTASEGTTTGSLVLATFADPGGAEALSEYSATIAWGDSSSSSSAGMIAVNNGVFSVSGSYAYAEEGTDPVTVTIHHGNAPDSIVSESIKVADLAVAATGGFPVQATQFVPSATQTVATFTDPAGAEPVADYAATIAWGDSTTSAGTITSAGGVFTVTGSHTYQGAGTFPVAVTVRHDSATPVVVTSTAVVMINAGILLLDPVGSGALSLSGNGTITVTGTAPIVVDSNNAAAIVLSGNGTLTASEIDVTGVPGTSVKGNGKLQATIHSGRAPTSDPLAGLTAPSAPTPTYAAVNDSGNGTITLQPGTYAGGIHITGSGTVNLAPGLYYLKGGGLSVSGSVTLTGTGVTIYDDPQSSTDTIAVSGKGAIRLSAPTSGPYTGIAIFEDRSSSMPISLSGSFNVNVTGIVYAPHAALNLSGSSTVVIQGASGSAFSGGLFVSDLTMTGNGSLTFTTGGGTSSALTATSLALAAGGAPSVVTAPTVVALDPVPAPSLAVAVPDDLATHVLASQTEALVRRLFGGAGSTPPQPLDSYLSDLPIHPGTSGRASMGSSQRTTRRTRPAIVLPHQTRGAGAVW
jgi:hypothetical protein